MSGVVCVLIGGETPTVITLTNQTATNIGSDNPADAGYSLVSSGDVQILNPSATTVGAWINKPTLVSDYEVEAVVTSSSGGGTLTGTTGTGVWQNLGTTRTWVLSSTLSGAFSQRVLTISIRDVATATVRATATATLQVEPF